MDDLAYNIAGKIHIEMLQEVKEYSIETSGLLSIISFAKFSILIVF